MKRGFQAPRLLLGAESLNGLVRASRDRALEVMARYREPESLAVTMSKALDAGAEGVLAGPSPALSAALAELKRPVPIFALLPGIPDFERHELGLGAEDLLERRWRRAALPLRMRLSLESLMRIPPPGHGDFVSRVPVLLELEAAALRVRDLRAVILSAPLTDLALAAGNRRFFQRLTRSMRRRFRAGAGFESRTLGPLLRRLREWEVRPDLVLGPVNPVGLMMKPSPAELLEELRTTKIPVIARELRAGGIVPLADGVRYALEHRAHGVAPDLVDLDDVAAELRRLFATTPA